MKILLISILIGFSISVYSQTEIGLKPVFSGNDTVNFQHIDQITMNQLLMTDMGKAKGTKKLVYDSLLFKAAEFHALYLKQKNDCGHNEPEFAWAMSKTDRIRFFISPFDDVYLKKGDKTNHVESAEICCLFTVREKITYQELSNRIMTLFRNSPNHWSIITQNMGSKKFVNAASVVARPIDGGYRIAVVILPNYYNKKYSEDPKSIINITKEIQSGLWDNSNKEGLFTSKQYLEMINEYNKRKKAG